MTRRATTVAALAGLIAIGGLANAAIGLRSFQAAADVPSGAATSVPAATAPSGAAVAGASTGPVINARRVAPLVSSLVGRARLRSALDGAIGPAAIGDAARTTCTRVDEGGVPSPPSTPPSRSSLRRPRRS